MMQQSQDRGELVFRAMGGIGGDLIDTAEHRRFAAGPWRRLLPMAACLALLVGLSLLTLPMLKQDSGQSQLVQPDLEEAVVSAPEKTAPDTAVQPKERLVVLDTVYYVEAVYTEEEATPYLGEPIGKVTKTDVPEWLGEQAYARKDSTVRNVQGVDIPLEIFVVQEKGYLYCLTYFVQTGSLFSMEDLQQPETFEALLTMEVPLFDKAAALSAEELLQMFLLSLELERLVGNRTADLNRYLWLAGETYVIPVADVTRQLDRYLQGYAFNPELCAAYDPQRHALVLQDLTPEAAEGVYRLVGDAKLNLLEQTLELQVARYADETSDIVLELRYYEIGLTQNGCIFRCIREATP